MLAKQMLRSAKLLLADAQYEQYFRQKMDEWGIDSPDDLSDDEKADFFDDVDEGWIADNE